MPKRFTLLFEFQGKKNCPRIKPEQRPFMYFKSIMLHHAGLLHPRLYSRSFPALSVTCHASQTVAGWMSSISSVMLQNQASCWSFWYSIPELFPTTLKWPCFSLRLDHCGLNRCHQYAWQYPPSDYWKCSQAYLLSIGECPA